jgi:hypothetical protein
MRRDSHACIRRQAGRGIAVGAGSGQIFLYAGTEGAVRDAGQLACDVLARYGVAAEFAVHHWHPVQERWESPEVPVPQAGAGFGAGQQQPGDGESAGSLVTEPLGWQVRVELGSHRQAVALARRLDDQGWAVARRGKLVIVAASGEGQARELAGQITREVPPDAVVVTGLVGVGWPFTPS